MSQIVQIDKLKWYNPSTRTLTRAGGIMTEQAQATCGYMIGKLDMGYDTACHIRCTQEPGPHSVHIHEANGLIVKKAFEKPAGTAQLDFQVQLAVQVQPSEAQKLAALFDGLPRDF